MSAPFLMSKRNRHYSQNNLHNTVLVIFLGLYPKSKSTSMQHVFNHVFKPAPSSAIFPPFPPPFPKFYCQIIHIWVFLRPLSAPPWVIWLWTLGPTIYFQIQNNIRQCITLHLVACYHHYSESNVIIRKYLDWRMPNYILTACYSSYGSVWHAWHTRACLAEVWFPMARRRSGRSTWR